MAEVGHDRGTFGSLLKKLQDAGFDKVSFDCDLNASPEDSSRWIVHASSGSYAVVGFGRTGEEALRLATETKPSDSSPPDAA